jgi:DNA-binding protein HU-beta
MNKTELVAAMADKAGLTKKDAEKALNAFTEVVTETIAAGDKVQLIGFGGFDTVVRAARKGKNLHTGKEIDIPESKAPRFKAGQPLKDAVNKK